MIPVSSLPKIFITHSPFLENLLNVPGQSRHGIAERIREFQAAWEDEGDTILQSICECTGLYFSQNIIEVFIVSLPVQAYSHPIIISGETPPERFVDVLTHMLIHTILWKNTLGKNITQSLELFYDEITQNNIYVDAVQQYILLDVLKSTERLQWEIQSAGSHSALEEAWQIVRSIGYRNLIEQIKKSAQPPQGEQGAERGVMPQ